MKTLKEFIDEHFNVLVLVGLFLSFAGIFLHVIHHSGDSTALNWTEHVADQILAALLGMMVGRVTSGGVGGSGNGSPPASSPNPPSPPATTTTK